MSLNKIIEKLTKELEEISTTGAGEAYDSKYAFSKDEEDENDNAENSGYHKVKESRFKKIAKNSFLKEASYKEYKRDTSMSSKQKVNKAIKEVASRLYKMERVINQNIKLKTEEGIDNKQYWKSTRNNLYKISERMMRIGEKLRKF
jgi:arylamine N-acetyltransferase